MILNRNNITLIKPLISIPEGSENQNEYRDVLNYETLQYCVYKQLELDNNELICLVNTLLVISASVNFITFLFLCL